MILQNTVCRHLQVLHEIIHNALNKYICVFLTDVSVSVVARSSSHRLCSAQCDHASSQITNVTSSLWFDSQSASRRDGLHSSPPHAL